MLAAACGGDGGSAGPDAGGADANPARPDGSTGSPGDDAGSDATGGGDARADAPADGPGPDASGPTPFRARPNGPVYAMVHAGNAFFLGGNFTALGTTSTPRLALLGRDGAVSPTCDLGAAFDGDVLSVAMTATALYVGGNFRNYHGASASGLAKLDRTTCALDTTFSPPGANGVSGGRGEVSAMIVAGSSLYVGGFFTAYRGVADSAIGLAKLDLATGAIDTTFSPPGANANGVGTGYVVGALAASSTSLYLGGYFLAYRGVADSARFVAKVDLTTGVLDTTFSPPGATANGFDGYVGALAVAGNALYVGGGFSGYRNATNAAKHLAKLDATTGALDTTFTLAGNGFNDPNDVIRALAATDSAVYVGGNFTAYRGAANAAHNLAKLDPTTGAVDTTFSPPGAGANGFDAEVRALSVSSAGLLVAGGFTGYRGVADSAHALARLDLASGALDTSFHAPGDDVLGFDYPVAGVASDANGVAAVGYFATYGGKRARRIAKISDTTFELDPTWNGSGLGFDQPVASIVVTGNAVYAGGGFTSYRGVANAARRIAKIDATTGALDTTFSPPGATANGFDEAVRTLVLAGGAVYAGGRFVSYRGGTNNARRIAKLDATTGALDATFASAGQNGFDGDVYTLAWGGTALYAGGDFHAYRGLDGSANNVAKLDPSSGALDATFHPLGSGGFDDEVYSIAVDGSSVYVGGDFTDYRGQAGVAQAIAKLDAQSGALDTTFSPPALNGFDSTVYVITVDGPTLWVGGSMNGYRGVTNSARGLAKLDARTGAIDTTFGPPGPTANGVERYVLATARVGDALYLGTDARRYRDLPAPYAVRVNVTTGAVQ